jgi:hypothetical protein
MIISRVARLLTKNSGNWLSRPATIQRDGISIILNIYLLNPSHNGPCVFRILSILPLFPLFPAEAVVSVIYNSLSMLFPLFLLLRFCPSVDCLIRDASTK